MAGLPASSAAGTYAARADENFKSPSFLGPYNSSAAERAGSSVVKPCVLSAMAVAEFPPHRGTASIVVGLALSPSTAFSGSKGCPSLLRWLAVSALRSLFTRTSRADS